MKNKLTVKELKMCLDGYDDDWTVSVAGDISITAAIGKGVIFVENGVIVIGRAEHEK